MALGKKVAAAQGSAEDRHTLRLVEMFHYTGMGQTRRMRRVVEDFREVLKQLGAAESRVRDFALRAVPNLEALHLSLEAGAPNLSGYLAVILAAVRDARSKWGALRALVCFCGCP